MNIAKSSYQVKGLPGVMVRNIEKTGLLRKKTFDPDQLAKEDDSSSLSDEDYDEIITRKRSTDIGKLMDKSDIEEIYYETTEL